MKSIDALLSNSEVFHNCLSALSDIEYHHKEPRDEELYSKCEEKVQKHVRLLDGLSLLMVFKAQHDVCAMTFEQKGSSATILWAKNDPATPTPSEQKYLDDLLRAIENQKKRNDILQLCVQQCFPKVVSRCKKAAKMFNINQNSKNHLGVTEMKPAHQKMEARLREAKALKAGSSLLNAIDWFIENLASVNNQSDLLQVCQLVSLAEHFTAEKPPEQYPVFHPLQHRRIDKLAAYAKVIGKVLRRCKQNGIKHLEQQQVRST